MKITSTQIFHMAQYRSLINLGILTWTWELLRDGNHPRREDKDPRDRNQDRRNNANVSGVTSKDIHGLNVGSQRTNYQRNHPGNTQLDSNNRKPATIVRELAILRASANVNAVNDKGYTV